MVCTCNVIPEFKAVSKSKERCMMSILGIYTHVHIHARMHTYMK